MEHDHDQSFLKKVEYLEAMDDGWRAVLADIDSILKTFGSLTPQGASGELKSLIDSSKKMQQSRRAQLDREFELNMALLQNGAVVEETSTSLTSQLFQQQQQPSLSELNGDDDDDLKWPRFVGAAWRQKTCPPQEQGLNFPGIIGQSSNGVSQLSQSLPNTDFLLNSQVSLHSRLLMQGSKLSNNNSTLLQENVTPKARDWPSDFDYDSQQRRHSLFGAPGEPLPVLANNSLLLLDRLGRHRARQRTDSFSTSHDIYEVASSMNTNSYCNSQEDISPISDDLENNHHQQTPCSSDQPDWDYDAMHNKVVQRSKKPFYPNHFHHQSNLAHSLPHAPSALSMRRASSPPAVPPYAFDSHHPFNHNNHYPSQHHQHHRGSVHHHHREHTISESSNASHGTGSNVGTGHNLPRRAMLGFAESLNSLQNICAAARSIIDKYNINASGEFSLDTKDARYIVIKSFTEESIFSSIKYSVWCSTFRGNQRLDKIYRSTSPAPIYLFFSVNNTGNFCGVAQMTSPVDFDRYAGCWSTPRWKGAFAVKWIFVKDVPFRDFRDIVLAGTEADATAKPVCKSRDTQEVLPAAQGVRMLKIFHERKIYSSIFDDFDWYEDKVRRQSLPTTNDDTPLASSKDSGIAAASSSSLAKKNPKSTPAVTALNIHQPAALVTSAGRDLEFFED